MLIILFSLWGAFLYRWRGHASEYKKYLPRPFNQILFAMPYGFLPLWLTPQKIELLGQEFYHTNVILAVTIVSITTAIILSGHGNGMDIAHAPRGKDDETMEFAVKWLYGRIPEYWYDAVLMSWLGMCITLSSGLASLNPVIALSGAMKGPAYMLGWFISDNAPHVRKRASNGEYYSGIKYLPRHLDEATGLGEAFTGLFLYAILGYCFSLSFA